MAEELAAGATSAARSTDDTVPAVTAVADQPRVATITAATGAARRSGTAVRPGAAVAEKPPAGPAGATVAYRVLAACAAGTAAAEQEGTVAAVATTAGPSHRRGRRRPRTADPSLATLAEQPPGVSARTAIPVVQRADAGAAGATDAAGAEQPGPRPHRYRRYHPPAAQARRRDGVAGPDVPAVAAEATITDQLRVPASSRQNR